VRTSRPPRSATAPTRSTATPLGDGSYSLNGGVGGTTGEVVEFVLAMSGAFAEAGIDHHFEVFDERQNLVRSVPQ
jgi:hypothetical protein